MKRKKRLPGSKWRKHTLLEKESDFQPHLPDTALYNKEELERFTARYDVVFLKPVYGQQGNKILKITPSDDGWQVSGSFGKKFDSLSDLHRAVEKLRKGKKFLIQQGIDLAPMKGRPVDLRIVVERDKQGDWTILKWFAKSAGKNQIVTNLHRGGTAHTITRYLAAALGWKLKRRRKMFRELRQLSLGLARFLGRSYGNRLYGLDMGIDRAGKLWLIEINTKPAIKDRLEAEQT